jgi:hypothetical protein
MAVLQFATPTRASTLQTAETGQGIRENLNRAFPITEGGSFGALLEAIDASDRKASPVGNT